MTLPYDLSADFGPSASYSEHKPGDRLRYLDEHQQERSGIVLYVCVPCQIHTKHIPLQYAVMPDHREGFPDMVAMGDVLE